MLTKKSEFSGKIEITNDLRLKVYLDKLSFNFDKIIDSAIGDIWQPKIVNLLIDLLLGTLKTVINTLFIRGWDIDWILSLLKIDFMSFSASELQPFDGYFILFFNPLFNIDSLFHDTLALSLFPEDDGTTLTIPNEVVQDYSLQAQEFLSSVAEGEMVYLDHNGREVNVN